MLMETETGRCRASGSEDGTQARACVPRSQGRHGQILPWGLWRDLRVSPGVSGTGSLSWRARGRSRTGAWRSLAGTRALSVVAASSGRPKKGGPPHFHPPHLLPLPASG